MAASISFHTADLQRLFEIIGSADRDLLLKIGVKPGDDLLADVDVADEEFEEEEEETEEDMGWDADEEEVISAREIITKMIMSEIPADLAENEAYAIQDYMANYVAQSEHAESIEPDEVVDYAESDLDEDALDEIREILLKGASLDAMGELVEWMQANGASSELITRLQMLQAGRIPYSDEATFTDTEAAYGARFGYLTNDEIAMVADEITELAPAAAEDMGYLPYALAALFHYSNASACDLVVTIEE
jgi:hypothetical protein